MPNRDKARNNIIFTILPIILVSFVSRIAANIYIPALPDITKDLSLSNAQSSSSITIYFLVLSFSCLVAGLIVDYYNKRKLLILSCGIIILGSLFCATTDGVAFLLLGRGLQAIGAAFIIVTSQSWLGQISSKESMVRVFAYFSLSLSIAPLFAPTIGGVVTEFLSWRYIFYLIIVLAIIAMLYFLQQSGITMPEVEKKELKLGAALRGYTELIASPRFIPVIGASLLCFFFQGGYITFSSFLFIDELGINPSTFGLLSVPIVVGLIAGRFLTIPIEKHYGIIKAYRFNSALIFIPTLISLLYYFVVGRHSLIELFATLIVFNAGFSGHILLSLRNAMILFRDKQGQVSASINFLNNMVSYFAALLVQILFYYNLSSVTSYHVFAILVLCVITMLNISLKRLKSVV